MIEPKPTKTRGGERRELHALVSVKPFGAKRASKAQMYDLSAKGCCVLSSEEWAAGMQLLIRIPGQEFMSATVAWRREGAVGLEFHRPLHPAMVDHVARHYPAPASPAEE